MATFEELEAATKALYASERTSSLGNLKSGSIEALLFLIATGGKLQLAGVSPDFTGFGQIAPPSQIRLPAKSKLVGFVCQQVGPTPVYVQMHDSTAAIAADAVPVQGFSIYVADSGGSGGLTLADHGPNGRNFGDDPVLCFSTAQDKFVAADATVLSTVMITGQVVT